MPELRTMPFVNIRERHAAMDIILHDRIVGAEFFNFICGDMIGSGISRYVFDYRIDPRYVVKIDCSVYNANSVEQLIWHEIEFVDKMSQWFAPVLTTTTCGRIMIQRKCKTGIAHDEYPKKIPDFFTDLKYQNWGMLNKKMVCFDYASTKLLDLKYDYKLVNAKWWVG